MGPKGKKSKEELQKLKAQGAAGDFEMDRIQLIHFPPSWIFTLVFLYCFLGAYCLHRWEQWEYHEALYFTFISILTVGFGDFVPKRPTHLLFCLFYVTLGVIFATTVVDSVGHQYLEKIHSLGRRLQDTDINALIRTWKYNRRKKQMAMLWVQFAKSFAFGMALPSPCYDSTVIGRFPPDPPKECQVISTTAYSVRLAWSPAFSRDPEVSYSIYYKLKSSSAKSTLTVRNIVGLEYEVKGLQSCSLYEFTLVAVSSNGSSRPIHFVQFTEPETSPQSITLDMVNSTTAFLKWKPPFKKRKKLVTYLVYYTDECTLNFSEWNKLPTADHSALFSNLQENKVYLFCICCVFKDRTKSPLSRSVVANTEISRLYQETCCKGSSINYVTLLVKLVDM